MQKEKIIEVKTCKHCSSNFEITDKDLEFYVKVSPIFHDRKYSIPTPTLCPDCRQQRRLSFRNERKLYKRKCSATGKDIVSIYSPDKSYKAYDQEIWWSDKWDALDYGRDFDFEKGFFEQFEELMREVPRMSMIMTDTYNSDYNNYCSFLKDCYMNFDVSNLEDCLYSHLITDCKNTIDSDISSNLENCYYNIGCLNCFNLFFALNCNNCTNSYYLYNCENCSFCINCSNLKNKSYYINNKEVSKEDFENIKKNLNFQNLSTLQNIYYNSFNKSGNIINSENSFGNDIFNSKNVYNCYSIVECEDCKYVIGANYIKDSYDYESALGPSELCLELNGTEKCYNCLFGIIVWGKSVYYSDHCISSNNCFGCVGLKNKQYFILNKQYTKEEYEKLVPQIIEHMQETGEWGEFFPSSISPFGYNETVAQEYFPLDCRDVLSKHLYKNGKQIFNWSDYEPPFPKVDKIIKAEMLPENISDIPDDILNWAIECEVTKKPFRIIKQELDFYRKHNLPIPKRHPDQRHLDRMSLRNPRKLFNRKCDKCHIEMKTTYSPDRKEIVYCEDCYNKEVY